MSQTQHDELAQLFAQQMNFSENVPQPQQTATYVHSVPAPEPEKQSEAPVHYISTHYTPTAHIQHVMTSEPSHSPPPSYHEAIIPEAVAETLRQHSIDPAALLPSQTHLFQTADYEQRLRLLELWRLAPPSYALEEHLGGWAETSVEKEEVAARLRYELQMQQREQQPSPQQEDLMQEDSIQDSQPQDEEPTSYWPPAARSRAASILSSPPRPASQAEPYMTSGYQAVDPVYAAAATLWQAPSYAQAMENQYGAMEQVRNHADWERMNEEIARSRFVGVHGGLDEDMVM